MSFEDLLSSSDNDEIVKSNDDDIYKSELKILKNKIEHLSKVARNLHKTNEHIVKKNKRLESEFTELLEKYNYIQNQDVIDITEHEQIIKTYKQKIKLLKQDKKRILELNRDLTYELKLKTQKIEDLKDRLDYRKFKQEQKTL